MVELELNGNNITYKTIPYVQADKEPDVKILKKQQEIEAFEKNIKELNAIIADDKTLQQKHNEFMKRTSKYYLSMLEPYTNRYLRALYIRGFLPTKMGIKRRLELLNHIECEAHLERLIYAIKNK